MEQLAPAASDAPQALVPVVMAKSSGLMPVITGTMPVSELVPVLVSVAASADEVTCTTVFGKVTTEVNVAVVVAEIPVPVRDEVCGDPVALSATDNVAEKLAAEAGVKVT